VLYPAFCTFKSLEDDNKDAECCEAESEEVAGIQSASQVRSPGKARWLMYWIVLALARMSETVVDPAADMIPMYHFWKFVLVWWLASPSTNGARIVYENYVAPLTRQNRPMLDHVVGDLERSVSKGSVHVLEFMLRKGMLLASHVRQQTITWLRQRSDAQQLQDAAPPTRHLRAQSSPPALDHNMQMRFRHMAANQQDDEQQQIFVIDEESTDSV
jgi:TB2/DP1, HVA22 family